MRLTKAVQRRWKKRVVAPYLSFRYRDQPFSEFYAAWMATEARADPKAAVGGRWDELGRLQIEYLRHHGLAPHHHLLDLGCGSLRAGLHFIDYLDPGHYVGLDISPEILEAGQRFLKESGLDTKEPTLLVNSDLTFRILDGRRFDFVMAQSVLTHLPLQDIEELFAHLKYALRENGIAFMTFHDGVHVRQRNVLNFVYPFQTLREIGENNGLVVIRMTDYQHPRGQAMMRITMAA